MKTGVFPQLAAGWEGQGLVIGHLLVATPALHRRTQRFNLARPFVADNVILQRVTLLLTAVSVLLTQWVFRAANGPFRTIDDELQPWTGGTSRGNDG